MAALRTGLAAILLLACAMAPAAPTPPTGAAAHPPTIVLEDTGAGLLDPVPGWQWIDPDGRTTLAQVLAGADGFTGWEPQRIHALGNEGALWIRLRIARPAASDVGWLMELPLPPLDRVTLYQQDRAGVWRAQSAGDRIAVASWPLPGRFPVFRLEVPPGEARDVFLKVQHNARSNIALRLATVAGHGVRMQMAYLGLGLVLGGLILLIGVCLVQSWVFRDRAFFGYAIYAGTLALAMAAHTGVAGHLLWPRSGFFADAAQGGLGLLAGAAALMFVRYLCAAALNQPRLAALARAIAWLSPLAIGAYAVLGRPVATLVLGAYLTTACALSVLLAWRAWRNGDRPSLWVLVSFLPIVAGVALALLRIYGLAPMSWANQYGVVAAMAVHIPLLLVALNLHARESHSATARALALSSHDALTGVLAPHLFHDRLRQLAARHQRSGDSAAVLFIDLVNHGAIKAQHGAAVAEHSLLRSVIRLRRLLRETDTLSRIGEARFGLILEGLSARVTLVDRAARVVAAAKLPTEGQRPVLGLQFHIACVLLDEVKMDGPQLEAALTELLDSMSPTTRRPIRFVGGPAPAAGVEPDSVRLALDSGLPGEATAPA